MIPKRMEYSSSLEKVKSSFTRVVKPGSDEGSPLLLVSLIAGNGAQAVARTLDCPDGCSAHSSCVQRSRGTVVLAASNVIVWQDNWAEQKAALEKAEEDEPEISNEPRYGGVFTKRSSSSSATLTVQ